MIENFIKTKKLFGTKRNKLGFQELMNYVWYFFFKECLVLL